MSPKPDRRTDKSVKVPHPGKVEDNRKYQGCDEKVSQGMEIAVVNHHGKQDIICNERNLPNLIKIRKIC